jgi:hypothetical protein
MSSSVGKHRKQATTLAEGQKIVVARRCGTPGGAERLFTVEYGLLRPRRADSAGAVACAWPAAVLLGRSCWRAFLSADGGLPCPASPY